MLYVHRVHNKGGMFDVMLVTPLDITDCRSVRVIYNNCNYVSVQLHNDPKYYLLHRLIVGDVPDGCEVDHIDNNPLNNARANLRIVTRMQIMLNRRLPNETGFTGASANGNGFSATVRMNGKCETTGTHATAKEAGMVRDEVMAAVGQGHCTLNFAQKDRCITDQQMRQIAEQASLQIVKMAYPSSAKSTDLRSIAALNLRLTLSKLVPAMQ